MLCQLKHSSLFSGVHLFRCSIRNDSSHEIPLRKKVQLKVRVQLDREPLPYVNEPGDFPRVSVMYCRAMVCDSTRYGTAHRCAACVRAKTPRWLGGTSVPPTLLVQQKQSHKHYYYERILRLAEPICAKAAQNQRRQAIESVDTRLSLPATDRCCSGIRL